MILSLRAELLVACTNQVGESPLWDAAYRQLFWLDIPAGKLFCRGSGGEVRQWQGRAPIGSIVLADDGTLIGGAKDGFIILSIAGTELLERNIAPILAGRADMRLNDGACDRQGRFWSGSMQMPVDPTNPCGVLYRLTQQRADAMLDGLLIQNGLAWSPDGRTMYLSDSHASRASIWAFDYDPETGVPSNRRLFVDLGPFGGRPDGAAVDADGCCWTTPATQAKSSGLRQADASMQKCWCRPAIRTNLCFGGEDLRTMFITSLRPGNPDPMAGNVFACEVPWQGIPETPFRRSR